MTRSMRELQEEFENMKEDELQEELEEEEVELEEKWEEFDQDCINISLDDHLTQAN